MPSTAPYEEILYSLIHDLRQPLGNLETGIFFLDLVLDKPSARVSEQLRRMERQVAEASQMLQSVVVELRALRAQRDAEGDAVASFDLTKSVTARVT